MIDLTRLTLDTPRDPKSVAEHLLGLGLLRPQIISLFAVSVCLSVISLFVSNVSMNGDNPFVIVVGPGLVMGPLPVAIMIFVMTLVSALASSRIGRMFGGTGGFQRLVDCHVLAAVDAICVSNALNAAVICFNRAKWFGILSDLCFDALDFRCDGGSCAWV